jgi:transposase InsO family protein
MIIRGDRIAMACIKSRSQLKLGIRHRQVRRVLARHYRPESGSNGPSWLTFLGHSKDSLWSVDLFRCESMILRSHWVMVVMDQFTRQIIGFSVLAGPVDGPAVCRLFNRILGTSAAPHYLSSDNDPLLKFHRWKANLRILDVAEVKTVPYVPLSHLWGANSYIGLRSNK